MQKKIAVLGAGSWGTALAMVLAENGHEVRIWGHHKDQITEINQKHTNHHYLPEIALSENIHAYADLKEAVNGVDGILFVVPTKATREVAEQVAQYLNSQPLIIHASKGLEQNSHKRISEVLNEVLPTQKVRSIAVLSGPSHAEEVAVKDITTITVACEDKEAAKEVQDWFMNDYFRVYTNEDVIGVEMGAALKNIIAVGAGVIHGLGYGDNDKSELMTRGLAEISRLGVAFGANPLTFIGLSGVGDLIVTCTSVHSRNWRAGNMLGQGKNLDDILENMGMIVEGVATTKAAYELAKEKQIDMPITNAIYHVLYENQSLSEAVKDLMGRDGKDEIDPAHVFKFKEEKSL